MGSDGGTVIYFRRAGADSGPPPTQVPQSDKGFAGVWEALRYEMTGISLDIKMIFPDGCRLTLRGDGTGEAFITKDYVEKLTWSQSGGSLSISGSFVLSDPVYDAEKDELRASYGTSDLTIVFRRAADADPAATPARGALP